MGEVVWVEILSRHRDVISRQRVELNADGEAFVGRGYGNDVLVDDPYVAPRHLRLRRDELGRLIAEDSGSINGLFLEDETSKRASVVLDGDRPVRIGRTYLCVREASNAVAPEREEPRAARAWHATLALSAAFAALTLLEAWLGDTGEPKLATYVFPILTMAAFVLVWSTAWALLDRIFSGRASFQRHLSIALVGFLAVSAIDILVEYLEYSFSLSSLSVRDSFEFWVWLAAMSFFHLREIGDRHLVLKGAIVSTLALLAIGAQMLTVAETFGGMGQPVAVTELKPPMFRLASPQSGHEFFDAAAELKPKLDVARTEEPTSGGMFWDFDPEE